MQQQACYCMLARTVAGCEACTGRLLVVSAAFAKAPRPCCSCGHNAQCLCSPGCWLYALSGHPTCVCCMPLCQICSCCPIAPCATVLLAIFCLNYCALDCRCCQALAAVRRRMAALHQAAVPHAHCADLLAAFRCTVLSCAVDRRCCRGPPAFETHLWLPLYC